MAYKIKELASKYLQSGNSHYSKQQIADAMDKLKSAISDFSSDNSLFNVKDMDAKTFKETMQSITNSSDGSLDNEIDILYSIMNTDGADGISSDEFTTAFDTYETDGKVSNFELWSNLGGVEDLDDDGTEKPKTSAKKTSEAAETSQATETTTSATPKAVKKPKSFAERSNWQDTINYINSFVNEDNEEFDTPQKVVTYLHDKGIINEEDGRNIMCAYIYASLTDDQKAIADAYMNEGLSLESVVNDILKIDINESAYYKKPSEVGKTDESAALEEEEKEPEEIEGLTLSPRQVDAYAQDLNDYINSGNAYQVMTILTDENFSDADIAGILAKYEEKYGSLIKAYNEKLLNPVEVNVDIDSAMDIAKKLPAYGINEIDKYTLANVMWTRVRKAAESGNPDAIKIIASETHYMDEHRGEVSNPFINNIYGDADSMSPMDSKTLSKVVLKYKELYGKDLLDYIKETNWYNVGDYYVELIRRANRQIE